MPPWLHPTSDVVPSIIEPTSDVVTSTFHPNSIDPCSSVWIWESHFFKNSSCSFVCAICRYETRHRLMRPPLHGLCGPRTLLVKLVQIRNTLPSCSTSTATTATPSLTVLKILVQDPASPVFLVVEPLSLAIFVTRNLPSVVGAWIFNYVCVGTFDPSFFPSQSIILNNQELRYHVRSKDSERTTNRACNTGRDNKKGDKLNTWMRRRHSFPWTLQTAVERWSVNESQEYSLSLCSVTSCDTQRDPFPTHTTTNALDVSSSTDNVLSNTRRNLVGTTLPRNRLSKQFLPRDDM